ncbi:flagellar hook-length control protein FliK [Tropicibacter sp. Alg240-R139]|uniref:flagellar hook-length control protein FliK n=1 Tax=Tropicibacter sp. Alg240-R139 TaxID=2305991 RepID=UPI0013E00FDA|nr:flagellar hook-length control protein FliK [Tropicibacter sp. Alg240-R139]
MVSADESGTPLDHDKKPVATSESEPDIDQISVTDEVVTQDDKNPFDKPVAARPRDVAEYVLASHRQLPPNGQAGSSPDLTAPAKQTARTANASNRNHGLATTPTHPNSVVSTVQSGLGFEISGDATTGPNNGSTTPHQPTAAATNASGLENRSTTFRSPARLQEQGPTTAGCPKASVQGNDPNVAQTDEKLNPETDAPIALSGSKHWSKPLERTNPDPHTSAKHAGFASPPTLVPASQKQSVTERTTLGRMRDTPAAGSDPDKPIIERNEATFAATPNAASLTQAGAQISAQFPKAAVPIASSALVNGLSSTIITERISPFFDDDRTALFNSLSVEDAVGLASSNTSVGHSIANGTEAPRGDVARSVGAQLAEQVAKRPQGAVDITLNPEELGRVRMTVNAGDSTVAISIMAERPETLDLMRRHVDQLIEEFRQLEYDGVEFAFSDGGATPDGSQGSATPHTRLAGSEILNDRPEPTEEIPNRPSRQTGLDIRL